MSGTQMAQQLIHPLDLIAVVLKTVGAKWLVQMHEFIQDNPGLIVNGFRKAGYHSFIDINSTYESISKQ